MKTLSFDRHTTQEIFFYPEKPVFHIIKINFISDNNRDWITKVNNGTLLLKVAALDSTYRELASEQIHISFSSYIEPQHVQPVLEVDQDYDLLKRISDQDLKKCKQWKVEFTLNNLLFQENDSLSVLYTNK